eukprot:gnl/Trimastix_PCT/2181.p1 GENE.gnl/Trimastix_PCT/2181~~gnl/Trimastix_PCT/2181.p1  ORF type:complete len:365 (+),score=79.98 gnl/Trimastix_PCT/2181:38-1132(+)
MNPHILTLFWLPFPLPKETKFETIFRCPEMNEQIKTCTLLRNQVAEAFKQPQNRDHPIVAIERYLPSLFGLAHSIKNNPLRLNHSLSIQWKVKTQRNQPTHGIESIDYEVAMILTAYAFALNNAAVDAANQLIRPDVQPTDESARSVIQFFRRAAGVFTWLADGPLAHWISLPATRPPEILADFARMMSLVCLGEAQLVAVLRARQKGTTHPNIARIALGAQMKFETAMHAMQSQHPQDWSELDAPLRESIAAATQHCRSIGLKHLGLALQETPGKIGEALGFLKASQDTLQGCHLKQIPEYFKRTIEMERDTTRASYDKLNKDNDLIYFERIVDAGRLSIPDGINMMECIAWQPPLPAFTDIK